MAVRFRLTVDSSGLATILTRASSSRSSRSAKAQELAQVIREGNRIVLPALPEPMPTMTGANILYALAEQERSTVDLHAEFNVPLYAGALAMVAVMERLFGFAVSRNTVRQTMFGPVSIPPDVINVPVGPGEYKEVLWGTFMIPGTKIMLNCSAAQKNGNLLAFSLNGECPYAERPLAAQFFDEIRKEIKENSIYKGKAIQFDQHPNGKLDLSKPDSIRFIRTDPELRHRIILNSSTLDAVETELFAPIEHYEFAKSAWKINMNRVVLLSGTYGTGKSLTGAALAGVAVANNCTFVLLKNVVALPEALELIRLLDLPRVVIFAEDIDRVMSGSRDQDKDTLLNLISGVESATSEVSLVLTTNNIEAIHPAMIRRFQAVVEYQLPDAEAAERLVRLYGAGRVSANKLIKSPKLLAGVLPSLIKDTVETAKLAAIRGARHEITDDDLVYAAQQLDTRKRLATRELKPEPLTTALAAVGEAMYNGQAEMLKDIYEYVQDR